MSSDKVKNQNVDQKIASESQRKSSWLFSNPCTFVTSVYSLNKLPEKKIPEIAFAGRSNVGKSSLLNFIFQKKGLAKASNTPGRTQCLNFFMLGENYLHVVDMPGYGYAKAPKEIVNKWTGMLKTYLRGRIQLKRVFLLIDSRHGLKKNDIEIMDMLDESAVSYQVVLTKIDKISSKEVEKRTIEVIEQFKNHPALYPEVIVSSSSKNTGLKDLQFAIASLVTKTKK